MKVLEYISLDYVSHLIILVGATLSVVKFLCGICKCRFGKRKFCITLAGGSTLQIKNLSSKNTYDLSIKTGGWKGGKLVPDEISFIKNINGQNTEYGRDSNKSLSAGVGGIVGTSNVEEMLRNEIESQKRYIFPVFYRSYKNGKVQRQDSECVFERPR